MAKLAARNTYKDDVVLPPVTPELVTVGNMATIDTNKLNTTSMANTVVLGLNSRAAIDVIRLLNIPSF